MRNLCVYDRFTLSYNKLILILHDSQQRQKWVLFEKLLYILANDAPPTLNLTDLVNRLSDRTPDASFLTNTVNAEFLKHGQRWLKQHLANT